MLIEAKKYSVEDFDYYIILLTVNIMKELGFSFDSNVHSKEDRLRVTCQNVTYNSLEHEIADTYLSTLKANLQQDIHNKKALLISNEASIKRDKKRLIAGIGLATTGIGVSSVSTALIATGKLGVLSAAAATWAGSVAGAGAVAGVEVGSWLGPGIMSAMSGGLAGGAVAGGIVLGALVAPIVSCIAVGVGGTLTAKFVHNYFKKRNAELIKKYKKNDDYHVAELIFALLTLCAVEKLSKKTKLEDLDESKLNRMAQKKFKLLMKNLVKQVKKKNFPHLISDTFLPSFMLQEHASPAQYQLKARELSFRYWLGALEQTIMEKNHSLDQQSFLVKLFKLRQKTERDLADLQNFRDQDRPSVEDNKSSPISAQTSKKGPTFFSPQKAHERNLSHAIEEHEMLRQLKCSTL